MNWSISWIKRCCDLWNVFLTATASVGSGLLVVSAFLVTYDIVVRWVLGSPSEWIFEYSVYMIASSAYFSAAYVLREKGHISVDILFFRLARNSKAVLEFVTMTWSTLICAVIAWSAFHLLQRSINIGQVSNTVLETPLWIPQLPMVIGFMLLTIQALIMTFQKAAEIGTLYFDKEYAKTHTFSKNGNPGALICFIFLLLGVGAVMMYLGGTVMMVAGLIIILLTLLITGTPVFLSMAMAGGIAFLFIFSNGLQSMTQLGPLGHSRLMSPVLTAVPFFIVGAGILARGGFSEKLFTFFQHWLPGVRGKLALVTVLACAMFAACTGSSPANAAAFSLVAIPAMLNRNYDKRLAYGAVAGGGTLGPMIPPSIAPIIFAEFTGLSVSSLLIAGVFPGLMITAVFAIYILFKCRGDKRYDADITERGESFKIKMDAFWQALPVFGVPVIVVGGLYSGIATPTETASLMFVYAIGIAISSKCLTLKKFIPTLNSLLITSTMVYIVTFSATILSAALLFLEAPQVITTAAANAPIAPIALILLIMIIFIILGMFLDPISIILVATPIVYPIITKLGFSGIWFCVLFNLNLEISMLTPPVGMNLYVLAGATKDRFEEIVKGCIPFALCLLICMIILIIFPQIATWLPDQIHR